MFGNKSKKDSQIPSQRKQNAAVHPQSEAKPTPPPVNETEHDDDEPANYISAGTVIEGNIVSSEDLQIDGTVKGDIQTSSKLILGEDSIIEGNIMAEEAEVSGRITGTVQAKGLLAIMKTCVIDGDIVTKSLNVESGSSFNGRCKVGASAERRSSSEIGGTTSTPKNVSPATAVLTSHSAAAKS
ncbi:MAG: polymer-forming cytoskeletal protein [Planctomycetaceae bacterium]|nr:polymer-forming cytoskeletal protein [Planctomycetaceae bacterium]